MYYPVTSLGPGNRVGIWVSGCEKRCKGCISPELWDLESGRDVHVDQLIAAIEAIPEKIDGITISGGEPFMQVGELNELVEKLTSQISDDIIIFSGYTLQALINMNDKRINDVLALISVLIDGEYLDYLNDGVGLRGSRNQKIHIFKNEKSYTDLETMVRSLQSVRFKDNILMIGIL